MNRILRFLNALLRGPVPEALYAVRCGGAVYMHPVHRSFMDTFLRNRKCPIWIGTVILRPSEQVMYESFCPAYMPTLTRWELARLAWRIS